MGTKRKIKVFAVLSGVLAAAAAAPQLLPAGVSAAACPDYPFCAVAPAAAANPGLPIFQQAVALHEQQKMAIQPTVDARIPGLAAHQAAEIKQFALMGRAPTTIAHEGDLARQRHNEELLIAFGKQQAAAALAAHM